jgi:hypothetical protein
MEGQMKAILRWTIATYLFCASTLAFAGNLPGGTGTRFWVGYNEAWFADHYPNWLASNPVWNLLFQTSVFSSQFNAKVIDAYFDGMKNGHAKIVRIWVFPGLQGIELNLSNSPGKKTVGLTLDSRCKPEDSMRKPDDSRCKPEVIGNLETVLKLAKHHGLMVEVVVLNAGDMLAAVDPTFPQLLPLQPYFKNLLLNNGAENGGEGERDTFKKKVLLPLLKLLNENRDVVYGLDLINEIEATFISNPPYFTFPDDVPKARDFIHDMAKFVKENSSLRVTSSLGGAGGDFAVTEIIGGLFSGLGLDFYDLHYYADGGQILDVTRLCNNLGGVPIILGEYGQKSQTSNDLLQLWTTANFLFTAKTTCFSAALAWMYQICTTPICAPVPPDNPRAFTYLRADGTLRPAYYVIKAYGLPSSPSD